MNSAAVFVRTLLRTSAIFIGTTVVFLHPPSDWSAATTAAGGHPARTVQAGEAPAENAVTKLIEAIADPVVEVRRQVAASLGTIGNPRALPALRRALNDDEPAVRRAALRAISKIERAAERR